MGNKLKHIHIKLGLFILLIIHMSCILHAQVEKNVIVFYSSGSFKPSKTELNKLLPILNKLKSNHNAQLRITGYCDDLGREELNDSLSLLRANFIATYFIQSGIKKERIIQLSGKGEITVQGIKHKEIEQRRKLNRRVEIEVLEINGKRNNYKKSLNDKNIDIGDIIILEGLHFVGGRTVLLPSSILLLDSLTQILKIRNEFEILIKGHVNNPSPPYADGDDIDTGLPNLSVARAKKVYDHFANNGISTARLSFIGMKGFYPLTMDRMHGDVNRRVEIQISKISKLDRGKGWQQMVERTKRQNELDEAKLNKPLIKQLDSILKNDQRYRAKLEETEAQFGWDSKQVKELWRLIEKNDSINLIQVKYILKKYGWLGPETIGHFGTTTLFLVIQHAPLVDQIKYLPMMREAVKSRKILPSDLALLEDRVALGQGKKQIYGSQVEMDPIKNNYRIAPLIDPDHVDKRRAAVGLEPLENYAKYWNIKWDPIQYKKDHR
jgi:outer membrane protein OmpA-like peptidoglycan-associated protein